LAVFDESDGDFTFVRGSKRTRTQAQSTGDVSETTLKTVVEDTGVEQRSAPARGRKKGNDVGEEADGEAKTKRRRVMAFDTPAKDAPVPKAEPARKAKNDAAATANGRTAQKARDEAKPEPPKRATRRSTRSSLEKASESSILEDDDDDRIEMVGVSSESAPAPAPSKFKLKRAEKQKPAASIPKTASPAPAPEEAEEPSQTHTPLIDHSHTSKTITLPFADTPIANKNKSMRSKNPSRRSSLGMRGRRASSLIDAGNAALPHADVPPEDFYKHISAEGLSEPRRLKQLLVWCAERAMPSKSAKGEERKIGGEGAQGAAELAARHIMEGLVKEIGNKGVLTDWFGREEDEVGKGRRRRVVKVPNPVNVENERRCGELEERLKRYVFLP
jgi:kinetochore protein Mis13/DSN1